MYIFGTLVLISYTIWSFSDGLLNSNELSYIFMVAFAGISTCYAEYRGTVTKTSVIINT